MTDTPYTPSVNPLARLLDGVDDVVERLKRNAETQGEHPADARAEVEPYNPRKIELTVAEVIEETLQYIRQLTVPA